MSHPDDLSRAARVYGRLLRAYPRAFRDRFGDAMRESFLADYAAIRQRSRFARATFWCRTATDAVWCGAKERRAERRRPPHGGPMPSMLTVDWRDAFRSLRATPIVTAVAVLSLALGIGANTALFSILNSLILKTLPVRDPGSLVLVDGGPWTNPIWQQIHDRRQHLFEDAFAWSSTRFDLSTHGETEYIPAAWASGELFDVLGVHAAIGRTFGPADDARNGGPDGPVAVISYGFWQRRFGGTPDVLGRRLTVNRLPVSIVGVTPSTFFGLEVGRTTEIIVPVNVRALMPGGVGTLDGRSTWWLDIIGRLRPGQTIDQAQTALQGIQPQIREATIPQNWNAAEQAHYLTDSKEFTLVNAATGESGLRKSYRAPLTTILVVVGAVLLIACANIANLLLARAAARRRELTVRLALGASRFRLARQLLAESLILAAAGAALGLFVARWGGALLVRQLATPTTGVALDLALDWRVLAFTSGVALLTSLIFGLGPAVGIRAIAPDEALKAESRSVAGDRRFSIRSLLVIGQVALSLCLVVAAALFLKTLTSLVYAPIGFDADRLIVASINAPSTIAADARGAFFERMQEATASVPGVERVAVSSLTPLGNSTWNTVVERDGDMPQLSDDDASPWVNAISPGWFATLGMRILRGRDIDAHDVAASPNVLVVNEAFVRRFFPGKDAVGRRIRAAIVGPNAGEYEIVGVVTDSIYRSARKGFEPTIYGPQTQLGADKASARVLIARAAAAQPETLTRGLAQAIARVDGTAAYTIQLVSAQQYSSVRQERLVAMLAGFFGALALLLAALGVYGVTAQAVNRRTTEIGIRMALGATAAGISRLVLGRVGWLLTAGVVAGAAITWWASRFVTTLLFGTTAGDPIAFASAAALLCLVSAVAGWLPARRAAHIDPARTLRQG